MEARKSIVRMLVTWYQCHFGGRGGVISGHPTTSIPHALLRRHLPIRPVTLHSHFTRWLSHLKNGGGDELYQMIPKIWVQALSTSSLTAGGMFERRLLEFPSRRIGNKSD